MGEFQYKYDDLFNPLLQALHNLGGSASISEMEEEIINLLELSDEEVKDIHRGNRTKLNYRLAWARNYLKNYGLLENSSRGVWSLTKIGTETEKVDKDYVNKHLKQQFVQKNDADATNDETSENVEIEKEQSWQDEALEVIKQIPADKSENLCQRMLRESGFTDVKVTGRSGDGGIDGKGVLSLSGLISFHIVFQCKRYKDTVGPSVVRDFRGAMMGRADKGIIITTARFTRDAILESRRDGTNPIDLIDGTEFVTKLKELNLGIDTVMVEEVKVNKEWFLDF